MQSRKRGVLVLEDGHFFAGVLFGGAVRSQGEVVFNTSSTGYQEILTDPSYEGQIVTLTTAHIGNYGVNAEDVESSHPRAAGLIVRDHHPAPSNWRADRTLDQYLSDAGIPGLSGVDTRALVLHLRDRGVLRGVIRAWPDEAERLPITGASFALEGVSRALIEALVEEGRAVPDMAGLDLASRVTCASAWEEPAWSGTARAWRVVALDFGIKRNIVRQLSRLGCDVVVVPAKTTAAEVLAMAPDGVLLSNGPGDPEPVTYAVETIRGLLGKVPVFGICLGHQLLGLALGGKTFKMRFGHRGANHPVRELATGKVEITSQNHGFAIDASSLDGREVSITHLHLNDETIAGIRHKRFPAFSVQYHPEASPGPHDSHYLFGRFVDLMERHRRRA